MAVNAPQDFKVAALVGKVQGVSQLVIAGHSTNIQTTEPPLTVGFANLLQPFATAVESWEIVSSSANDAAAGTGARTVLVQYLDANYAQQQALITLDGLTPVAIAANCFRHQTTTVVTTGSGAHNAGQLTIRVAGGGATRVLVAIDEGASRQASFTTPAGHNAFIQSTAITVGRRTGPGVLAVIEAHLISSNGTHRLGLDFTIGEPGIDLTFPSGILLPEKTTIDYEVVAVSANGVDVSILAAGLLVNTATLLWPTT